MIIAVSGAARPPETLSTATFADLTTANLIGIQLATRTSFALVFDADLDGPTQAAIVSRCTTVNNNQADLITQANSALNGCRAFLANQSPTNADVLAQVRLLTRISIGLIRLQLGELDGEG